MFRSRWTGPDEEWTVMADDVRYAARPSREEAVAVMERDMHLARKFGDDVRVVRTVAAIKSRPIPWRRRKLRALMWRIGNPDLKLKAWRRRRQMERRFDEYEKREGRLYARATDDR
jgi:hypothetical protein